jgi:hypothetical protein
MSWAAHDVAPFLWTIEFHLSRRRSATWVTDYRSTSASGRKGNGSSGITVEPNAIFHLLWPAAIEAPSMRALCFLTISLQASRQENRCHAHTDLAGDLIGLYLVQRYDFLSYIKRWQRQQTNSCAPRSNRMQKLYQHFSYYYITFELANKYI